MLRRRRSQGRPTCRAPNPPPRDGRSDDVDAAQAPSRPCSSPGGGRPGVRLVSLRLADHHDEGALVDGRGRDTGIGSVTQLDGDAQHALEKVSASQAPHSRPCRRRPARSCQASATARQGCSTPALRSHLVVGHHPAHIVSRIVRGCSRISLHEVLVAALLRGYRIPGDVHRSALHHGAIQFPRHSRPARARLGHHPRDVSRVGRQRGIVPTPGNTPLPRPNQGLWDHKVLGFDHRCSHGDGK